MKRTNFLNNLNLGEYTYFDKNSNFIPPEHIGFTKNFIYISKSLETIIFETLKPTRVLEIKICNIEKTIITKTTKAIISSHQKLRNLQKNFKNVQTNLNDHFQDDMDAELRNKYLGVNNFMFSILMNTGVRIEILLYSYDEFKYFVNGLNLLINNKQLSSLSNFIVKDNKLISM